MALVRNEHRNGVARILEFAAPRIVGDTRWLIR